MQPFHELRIIEIAGREAGAYAAKLFADLGARVLKIEPPGGDPRRNAGEPWGDMGTTFAALNTSKQSLVLDLTAADGQRMLTGLVQGADVVVESASPDPLLPVTEGIVAPRLVRTYISPFGRTGPYAAYRSNPFTDEAIGGHLYLNGEPSREPIRRPGLHTAYQAGTHAFIGTAAALLARERTGRGQTVEVSHYEGLASLHQHTTTMWTHAGFILRREGNRQPGLWHPVGIYPCKDGHVQLSLPSQAMVEPFLYAAGLGHLLDDPRFADDLARGTNKDAFDEAIRPWLMGHTIAEIVELGQAVATPVGPVPTMLEVAADEHLAARDYWAELPGEPPAKLPRGPFRVSGHDSRPAPPPVLDAHGDLWGPVEARSQQPEDEEPRGPLDGIRVLDLTRVWAGPLGGRLLADLGADVIAVETPWGRGRRNVSPNAPFITHLYPENELGEHPWNRVGGFNKLFRNRRGITLDLKDERCRGLFAQLIASADVILQNFSPRVMEQLGFGDERLLELNPGIIHTSMPGYGATGPHRNWVAFGPLIEASSGLSSMMGYANSGPYRSGIAFPDPVSGMNAAAGTLVALLDRAADPEHRGRQVETAMVEAMGAFVADELLAAQVRGANPPRRGNREAGVAPQGVYPCAGGDRWIAISIVDDAAWTALCAAAGLGEEWRSLDLDARAARHDEIDAGLTRWTRSQTPHALMADLQSRGIIAAVVSDARDLVESAQLAERGFWARLEHPCVGWRITPGAPIHLSETPVRYLRPAPTLGQHNDEILGGELGLRAEELALLRASGAITEEPRSPG